MISTQVSIQLRLQQNPIVTSCEFCASWVLELEKFYLGENCTMPLRFSTPYGDLPGFVVPAIMKGNFTQLHPVNHLCLFLNWAALFMITTP